MKLLILGLNYAPEPVGIGPYTTGLAETLAERGHEVSVVGGKPYYPQWRAYAGQPPGLTEGIEHGVAVTRVPHYIPYNPTGARRIAHHLSFAAAARAPMMRGARERPDLVFAVAPSLLSVPVAARAARQAGVPLWVHVQDFEVEAAFATGLINSSSLAARIGKAAEQRILGMADLVSTISPQMLARLVEKGIPHERTFELRNWSNADFGNASDDAATYRRDWQLRDRHVALYSGNIANKQGLDLVIEAARTLAARDDIVFVICGEGPNRGPLEQLARGLRNVRFADLQPAERMGGLLSLAAVHLLPQIPGAADLVLPSKLTNMLASGRPVVVTTVPGTGLHAEVEGCGVATHPGDAEAFANAIAGLVDDHERRLALGDQARTRAVQRWSRDVIIGEMEARAEQLVSDWRAQLRTGG